ncbi:peptidase S51 dipeptidase E [Halobacillus fulvus]|nr:peptidase S51 dipeptidase E [Halobacillus fulvus]
MYRHLFLFGSSPPFNHQLGKAFSQKVHHTKIAILYIDREGSEEYLPKYIETLNIPNIQTYPLALKEAYEEHEVEELKQCGGIIIGGGHTLSYHKFIVETEIADVIRELFSQGVPVAGFSAGALITPAHCVISPKDNEEGSQLLKEGLGLLSDAILSAHFLEWDEEEALRTAMHRTESFIGYGIAECSGIYLCNGKIRMSEGFVQIEQ